MTLVLQVGSIVRSKRRPLLQNVDSSPSKRDHTGTAVGRAVVATITSAANKNDDDTGYTDNGDSNNMASSSSTLTLYCLIWEGLLPKPISPMTRQDFFITPKTIDTNKESEQEEVTVTMEEIQQLLPFEEEQNDTSNCKLRHDDGSFSMEQTTTMDSSSSPSSKKTIGVTTSMWKERGDTLLRLGDASSAASYYERALWECSQVSIGATIIVSVQGFPKSAEVDCLDDDRIDITIVESGGELTVKKSAVLLTIMRGSDPEQLQERILLNLARCMLQLADLDIINRSSYLKSAVLAATLVITISLFRREKDDHQKEDQQQPMLLPINSQKALILRSNAQTGLSKFANAMADAKQLVKAGNGQGSKILAILERKRKLQAKVDKILAKEMCRLVSSATNSDGIQF